MAFSASASDPDGVREYIWTFGDGTYAYGPSPEKTFYLDGDYPVHLTVVDQAGNAVQDTIMVRVGSGSSERPQAPGNLRIIRR